MDGTRREEKRGQEKLGEALNCLPGRQQQQLSGRTDNNSHCYGTGKEHFISQLVDQSRTLKGECGRRRAGRELLIYGWYDRQETPHPHVGEWNRCPWSSSSLSLSSSFPNRLSMPRIMALIRWPIYLFLLNCWSQMHWPMDIYPGACGGGVW